MKYKKSVWNTFSLISQLGISIIVPILLCVLLGVFLNDKFSISIMVPLIVTGVLAGIRNAIVLAKQTLKMMKDEEDEEKEG